MLNYNGKRFGMLSTSTGASNETVFHYRQEGDVAWGTYFGGSVIVGAFVANVRADGVLDLHFAHARVAGGLVTGVSVSTPEVLADGRIRLTEDFVFTGGSGEKGVSVVEEITSWPDEPSAAIVSSAAVNYDGRRFASVSNTPNGEAGRNTIFEYHQVDGRGVWATYSGGNIRMGTLVAVVEADGALDMRYQHVNADGEIRTGTCRSTPNELADGRIRLREQWQWTNGDETRGESTVEEISM